MKCQHKDLGLRALPDKDRDSSPLPGDQHQAECRPEQDRAPVAHLLVAARHRAEELI